MTSTRHKRWVGMLLVLAGTASRADAADSSVRADALNALSRATTYFRTKVATRGGYLWKYSLDLKQREGEGKATASQIWCQPPGTPAVGMAFLHAYEATGDKTYLEAARDAARALVWGQLESGGWDYKIEFDKKPSKNWYYRRDKEAGQNSAAKRRNTTTFDDNVSQSATRLLMRVDRAYDFKDAEIHRAVRYALTKFIAAQYPNGAWPQRFSAPPDPKKFPVCKARYPENWSRTYKRESYSRHYTFNDNAIQDVIRTMLEAYETYHDDAYLAAARKGGDFILLAQMPEPQPVWAQQYNTNMEPAWARKFEPPSVVSAESVGVIAVLLELYLATGDKKYIQTLPPAFEWFKRSKLPDGKRARFYELKINKPLYFTKKYELVYTDDDMPTHYGFKGSYDPSSYEEQYKKLLKMDRAAYLAEQEGAARKSHASQGYEKTVKRIIEQLDEQGRWVRDGSIYCNTFNGNVTTLANYLGATRY